MLYAIIIAWDNLLCVPETRMQKHPDIGNNKDDMHKSWIAPQFNWLTLSHLQSFLPSEGFEANVAAVIKWTNEIKTRMVVVGKDRMKIDVFSL